MAKRNSKLNLGYFCSLKNIVPIILVAIIVFFVFNLLQNKSFNPLFEGLDGVQLDEKVQDSEDEMIEKLKQNMIKRLEPDIDKHEKNHTGIPNHNHVFDSVSNALDKHVNDNNYHTTATTSTSDN